MLKMIGAVEQAEISHQLYRYVQDVRLWPLVDSIRCLRIVPILKSGRGFPSKAPAQAVFDHLCLDDPLLPSAVR
jgi:hypothetical protein